MSVFLFKVRDLKYLREIRLKVSLFQDGIDYQKRVEILLSPLMTTPDIIITTYNIYIKKWLMSK